MNNAYHHRTHQPYPGVQGSHAYPALSQAPQNRIQASPRTANTRAFTGGGFPGAGGGFPGVGPQGGFFDGGFGGGFPGAGGGFFGGPPAGGGFYGAPPGADGFLGGGGFPGAGAAAGAGQAAGGSGLLGGLLGGGGAGQAAGAGAAAGSGFNLAQLQNIVGRMGGIDGILGTMTKMQKIFGTMQQMAPMIKLLAGSFGSKGKASVKNKRESLDGLPVGGKGKRRRKSGSPGRGGPQRGRNVNRRKRRR